MTEQGCIPEVLIAANLLETKLSYFTLHSHSVVGNPVSTVPHIVKDEEWFVK
jgi:hypothetical protein